MRPGAARTPLAKKAHLLFSFLVVVNFVAFVLLGPFAAFAAKEEKTVALQPFRGVSICAPISIRIVDANSSSSSSSFSAKLVGERAAIDSISLTTTGSSSLSVQLFPGKDLDTGPGILELEIALPAGTLQYVERVFAPGDTVILSEFDTEKAEVASSGAGNIFIPFLNGRQPQGKKKSSSTGKKSSRLSMSKITLSAPGKVAISGDAGFWEVFTADERAEVRIDGVAIPKTEDENQSPYSRLWRWSGTTSIACTYSRFSRRRMTWTCPPGPVMTTAGR